ncbi:type II toxin-antitoxin system ParD family antitoxin [filamentous cyanobacterium CCP5]|nr:type II toxin-antitoxin system ParD family antitoxin [filamentous cyanobacterium CCP5]
MEISLSPEIEQYVQDKVSSGQYATASEEFLAGIQLLKDIDRIYQGRYEALRQDVKIGLEAAERGEMVDSETVFSQLHERLNQRRGQMP